MHMQPVQDQGFDVRLGFNMTEVETVFLQFSFSSFFSQNPNICSVLLENKFPKCLCVISTINNFNYQNLIFS